LFLVAVTFNISHKRVITNALWCGEKWREWQENWKAVVFMMVLQLCRRYDTRLLWK